MADILVVGKRDSILGFRTIGIETLFWEDKANSLSLLKENIEKGSKIIFVTENIFMELKELIDTYFGRLYPIFVPIPDINGSQGVGSENIRRLVIRALGTDIFGNS